MTRLTRAESQARTRTQLLATARELFLRDGYLATSLDKVADAAGFSKGAVYSNFRNKDQLCLAVLDEIRAERTAEVTGLLIAPTVEDRLHRFEEWAERVIGDPQWTTLEFEFAMQARRDPVLRRELATRLATVGEVVQSAVAGLTSPAHRPDVTGHGEASESDATNRDARDREATAQNTPGEGTPGLDTPGEGTPGVGTPSAGTPRKGTPGVGAQGVGTPSQGTPSQGTPGIGTPSESTPGVGAPDRAAGQDTPSRHTAVRGAADQVTAGQDTAGQDTAGRGGLGVSTVGELPMATDQAAVALLCLGVGLGLFRSIDPGMPVAALVNTVRVLAGLPARG